MKTTRQNFIPTQMVYDGNSRLAMLIDERGNETSYACGLLDRQVTMTFQDCSYRTVAGALGEDVAAW